MKTKQDIQAARKFLDELVESAEECGDMTMMVTTRQLRSVLSWVLCDGHSDAEPFRRMVDSMASLSEDTPHRSRSFFGEG